MPGAPTPALLNRTSRAAERFLGRGEQSFDGVRFADVGGHGEHLAAGRLCQRGCPFKFGGAAPGEHNAVPRGLQAQGGRTAYAAAAAGDERNFGIVCHVRFSSHWNRVRNTKRPTAQIRTEQSRARQGAGPR